MRSGFKRFAALAAALVMLFLIVGCVGNNAEMNDADGEERAELDYSNIKASDYISTIEYKNTEVLLASEDASRQDAVWDAVIASAQISTYPEEPVRYYFEQTKRYYMITVDNNEEDYQKLLESRGISETDMQNEARALVKKDLVFMYIVEAEQISVSEAEKEELFGRYVDKYVSEYGYRREYVTENMRELIYESMLYDKTTEYLLINNTFTVTNN